VQIKKCCEQCLSNDFIRENYDKCIFCGEDLGRAEILKNRKEFVRKHWSNLIKSAEE
jgi:hypothetical protein